MISSKSFFIFLLLFSCQSSKLLSTLSDVQGNRAKRQSSEQEPLPRFSDLPENQQHLKYGFPSLRIEEYVPDTTMPNSTITFKKWFRNKFGYAPCSNEGTTVNILRCTWEKIALERRAWDAAGKGIQYPSWGDLRAAYLLFKCKLSHGYGPGDCPDPCARQPCENLLHSTKNCTKLFYGLLKSDYSCGCLPGHNWTIVTGSETGSCGGSTGTGTENVTGYVTNTTGTSAQTEGSGAGAVVGGVICVLIIVGIAGGIVFFIKRKKNAKKEGTQEEKEPLSKSGSKQSNISRRSSRSRK